MTVDIKAVPRSKHTSAELAGETVVVRITAPPVDGKANDAVAVALSEILGIPKRDITIMRGQTSRNKTIEIEGFTKDEFMTRLAQANR
ncbi:MAG: hypothetical protein A2Y33_06955 [Spirochaetes bacterium GWF1_51_8]|nr:MAG: hypothetical protein A2Y33_06955 [Spirochaetes bacterium GWF1_51_8]